MGITRRDLGRLLGAGLLVPRPVMAVTPSERKFLFIFCAGGWDPTQVFTPYLTDPDIWVDPEASPAEAGGIPYLSAASRPAVDTFFDSWADKTAIINGIEVRRLQDPFKIHSRSAQYQCYFVLNYLSSSRDAAELPERARRPCP